MSAELMSISLINSTSVHQGRPKSLYSKDLGRELMSELISTPLPFPVNYFPYLHYWPLVPTITYQLLKGRKVEKTII